jgi:DNA modification methylase
VTEIAIVDHSSGELLPLPGHWSRTSLALPDNLTFEEWSSVGEQLAQVADATMWWIGDWWHYGDHQYGERAKAVAEHHRYAYQTFKNAGSIAGEFERSRRRDLLPWSHHEAVAGLKPAEQDSLLDQAEVHKWPRAKLREAVLAFKQQARSAATAALAAGLPEGIEVRQQDCLDLIASLTDGSVSLLATDPPYAVTENDWDVWETEDAYWKFMADWLMALRPKMTEEYTAFVFCDADATSRLEHALRETGWEVARQVIWHRPNLAKKRSGSITFLSSYEPFWHAGTRALAMPEVWGEERFDVQEFVAPQSNHVEDPAYHPTQKPLALMRRLVQVGSLPGELVVDPFCGAGTTPLACKHEGRRCVAGDQSPHYVQIARGRLA